MVEAFTVATGASIALSIALLVKNFGIFRFANKEYGGAPR